VTVYVASCSDYELSSVRQSVTALFSSSGIAEIVPQEGTVLIKPNLLSATKGPEKPVNTHPAVIQALAEVLIEQYHCRVWIGDSSNSFSGHSTNEAFRNMGIDIMAGEPGLKLIDFNKDVPAKIAFPDSPYWNYVTVGQSVFQADLVISVPKLKTHSLCGTTLSIKNLVGLVQGSEKRAMHALAPHPDVFAELVLDLFGRVAPGLALIDGIIGMEGEGPAVGDPVHTGVLIASADPVAADAVGSAIMGFDPMENEIISRGYRRGYGEAHPDITAVSGDQQDILRKKPYRKPKSIAHKRIILKILPKKMVQFLLWLISRVPFAVPGKCCSCGVCRDVCPFNAVSMLSDSACIDPATCKECFCCQEFCPYDAITLKRRPIAVIRNFFTFLFTEKNVE